MSNSEQKLTLAAISRKYGGAVDVVPYMKLRQLYLICIKHKIHIYGSDDTGIKPNQIILTQFLIWFSPNGFAKCHLMLRLVLWLKGGNFPEGIA